MKNNSFFTFFIAATIAALGNQASAGSTHVKGGACYGTPQSLTCDHLGKVTISEIYERGWRVVSYVKEGPNTISVVIEEQK